MTTDPYDLELQSGRTEWGTRKRAAMIVRRIEKLGGRVTDTYIRDSYGTWIVLMRIHISLDSVEIVRNWHEVYRLGLPPRPQLGMS